MIKIYLKYPWKVIDSSYYRNLLNFPPKEVEYVNKKDFRSINSKTGFRINTFLKNRARKIINIIKIPNIVFPKSNDADLIHCAHCLSLGEKPWVVDFERYESLAATGEIARSEKGRTMITKILKKRSCKKILPWTEAAKKSLLEQINEPEINRKIELLPFALPLKRYKLRKERGKVNILFIGRYFEAKGGYVAMRVIDFLTKKYPYVQGIIVSETPQEVIKKYGTNKKIKFHNIMGQEKLFGEIYPTADIFFYPGFSDTFGFALTEAMMFKLPIITFEGFARDEIVIEGKNGYIINKKKEDENWRNFRRNIDNVERSFIDEAIKKTEKLILNKKLRKKMGDYGYRMVGAGKFSIKNRGKKIRKIYSEALK